jgi:hypothetical protein
MSGHTALFGDMSGHTAFCDMSGHTALCGHKHVASKTAVNFLISMLL